MSQNRNGGIDKQPWRQHIQQPLIPLSTRDALLLMPNQWSGRTSLRNADLIDIGLARMPMNAGLVTIGALSNIRPDALREAVRSSTAEGEQKLHLDLSTATRYLTTWDYATGSPERAQAVLAHRISLYTDRSGALTHIWLALDFVWVHPKYRERGFAHHLAQHFVNYCTQYRIHPWPHADQSHPSRIAETGIDVTLYAVLQSPGGARFCESISRFFEHQANRWKADRNPDPSVAPRRPRALWAVRRLDEDVA